MNKPLIGITSSIRVNESGWEYAQVYAPNARAIERAGGLPVMIPINLATESLRAIYERLDGVLLPGGGDVDPAVYHADQHPATMRISRMRDDVEINLARWTVEDDRPLLGICRGIQVVNVALGGTLIQDIPSQVETTLVHATPHTQPRNHRAHAVEIDPSSKLAALLGTTSITVNSLHHQSSQEHGPSVCFTAHAPDGIIEALEIPDRRFAIGVQWHPEDMVDDAAAQMLFQGFVDAAAAWASQH